MPPSSAPRVYLAGPGVFRADAIAYGHHLRSLCAQAGLEGLYPLDNEIAVASPQAMARAIHNANIALIERSDAVIADISPFRGPNMDPGTSWEIGYAVARHLPLFLYTSDARTLLARTQASHTLSARDGGYADASGMSVEDFGLIENLMIAASAEQIFASAEDAIAACAAYFAEL